MFNLIQQNNLASMLNFKIILYIIAGLFYVLVHILQRYFNQIDLEQELPSESKQASPEKTQPRQQPYSPSKRIIPVREAQQSPKNTPLIQVSAPKKGFASIDPTKKPIYPEKAKNKLEHTLGKYQGMQKAIVASEILYPKYSL